MNESDKIINIYKSRTEGTLYSYIRPEVFYEVYQKNKLIARYLRESFEIENLKDLLLLDVGCGYGDFILEALRIGFDPKNIFGIELLADRYDLCKVRLPSAVQLVNQSILDWKTELKFDIIYISLVYTSLLSDETRLNFTEKIKDLLSESGKIIIYDFVFNNPSNKNVRKFSIRDLYRLFNGFQIKSYRTTIMPPLSRLISKRAAFSLPLFSFLTSHRLTFIKKNFF